MASVTSCNNLALATIMVNKKVSQGVNGVDGKMDLSYQLKT